MLYFKNHLTRKFQRKRIKAATHKTEQSLAYLLRNEILTNIEYKPAEFPYLLNASRRIRRGFELDATNASNAMKRYLEVVPPNELRPMNCWRWRRVVSKQYA